MEQARRLDIAGRTTMAKDELVQPSPNRATPGASFVTHGCRRVTAGSPAHVHDDTAGGDN
jgi:hypothetical protein